MSELRLLSIVIPAYNERETIEELLRRVAEAPLPGDLQREIVVVDDGSTDGTRELLREIETAGGRRSGGRRSGGRRSGDPAAGGPAAGAPAIRLIEQPKNRGKGAALATGFTAAAGDVILIQDADLEYTPDDYPVLLQPILDGLADVVYGSRFLGGPHRVLFYWHYLGNQFLTMLSNMLTDLNLSDMETCYKVFRAEVLKDMKLCSQRFGIEPELTAKVARTRARIYEVPISYHGRTYAEGKKIGWKDGVSAIWSILRYNLGPK